MSRQRIPPLAAVFLQVDQFPTHYQWVDGFSHFLQSISFQSIKEGAVEFPPPNLSTQIVKRLTLKKKYTWPLGTTTMTTVHVP